MEVTSFSLLDRLREQPDDESWQRLVDLYTPLIHGWLRRHAPPVSDRDDLVQEVMSVVVRRLPTSSTTAGSAPSAPGCAPSRSTACATTGRPASTARRDRRERLPRGARSARRPGEPAQPAWDREHDEHVGRRLLELIEPLFAPTTWQAFRGVTLEGRSPEDVAQALASRRMPCSSPSRASWPRLRQEARGLVD